MNLNTVMKALVGAGLLTAQSAIAETSLNAGSGVGETSSFHWVFEQMAAKATSEGVKVQVFGAELLGLGEIPQGVTDGVIDIGLVVTPYFPAEFSEINLAANASMLATSGKPTKWPGPVAGLAITDYVLNSADSLNQMKQRNQVFLGTGAGIPYWLLCNKTRIESMADLEGKKIRATANFGRWAESMGATAVSIGAGDVYEALAQGVVDCTAMETVQLTNFSLADVVTSVTAGVPGGIFNGLGVNVNRDTWQSLSAEERDALFNAAIESHAAYTWEFNRIGRENWERLEEWGIEGVQADDALLAATNAFVQSDLAVVQSQFTDKYGVADVEEKLAKIAELTEHYKDVVANVETNDRETWAKIFRDEIFSKLDKSTYGLD